VRIRHCHLAVMIASASSALAQLIGAAVRMERITE
jgi:hypothetical protein